MVEVMKIMVISFKRSQHALLHSVPPALQQVTTHPRLHWVLVLTRFIWTLWASLAGTGLFLNVNSPLLPSCWGFSFALECGGISLQLLQHLLCYWGFSDFGRGLSPHGWSSEGQLPLLTLNVGYKVMLKILQVNLQQYLNHELPDVQTGFRKGRGMRYQIANILWIINKAREFQKNIFLLYWLCLWLCGSK